jgi:CarD family transcriptional regulator
MMAARKKSTKKSAKASGTKQEKTSSARASRQRAGTRSASSSARRRGAQPKISSRKKAPAKRAERAAAPNKKRKTGGAAVSRVSKTAKKKVARSAKPKTAAKSPVKARKEPRRPAQVDVGVKSGNKHVEPKLQPKNVTGIRPVAGAASSPLKSAKGGSPATATVAATPVAAAVKALPQAVRDQGGKDQKVALPEVAPAVAKPNKPTGQRQGFKVNEFVVYPAHGVGQIVSIEEQEVAGFKLELFVISFSKDKMTLRVPTSKVTAVGMRKISDPDAARRSLEILTGRARIKRTMWSRRAQEYETKINSGDINAIAEVVRDLYRSDAQPEQSYSERQLYEAALDRMVREIAAVQKSSEIDALKAVEAQLQKNQGRTKPPGAPQNEAKDPEIEEAA